MGRQGKEFQEPCWRVGNVTRGKDLPAGPGLLFLPDDVAGRHTALMKEVLQRGKFVLHFAS